MYFNILYLVSLCSYDTLKSYMYKYSSYVAQYTPARIKMIIYVSIHFREKQHIAGFIQINWTPHLIRPVLAPG